VGDDSDIPDRVAWALEACRTLQRQCLEAVPAEGRTEAFEQLLAAFERLLELMASLSPEYEHQGRVVLARIQSQLPDLWPHVDRRLLWFFGGDCLHFLSDEEIDAFQAAEDQI